MEPQSDENPKQRQNAIAPWGLDETTLLIQAYQEKWYSLRRGQLKSPHWEEVSVTVAARSGHDDPCASKSALQCRHKMEKLRRRFRSESARVGPSGSSAWPFFGPMDRLLRGPLPITARPMALRARRSKNRGGPGEGLVGRVAAEIRGFAERLVAMEGARAEAARETERAWVAMERKRLELIVRSHSMIEDSIARVFA